MILLHGSGTPHNQHSSYPLASKAPRPPSLLGVQFSPVTQPAEEVYAGQVIGLHNKAGSAFAVRFRIIAFPLVGFLGRVWR